MVVTARLDNLGKGAAGAAVQCMNVHLGVDEATSLRVEAPIPEEGAAHAVREAAPGFAS
jgi:N-acetyl-gamma-glutamyl-phosphate reductase